VFLRYKVNPPSDFHCVWSADRFRLQFASQGSGWSKKIELWICSLLEGRGPPAAATRREIKSEATKPIVPALTQNLTKCGKLEQISSCPPCAAR